MRRLAVVVLLAVLAVVPASAEWRVESKDGETSIKLGFLIQPWAQAVETPDATNWSYNMFFRRLRFMAGGQVTKNFSFFVETDSPFLGRGDQDGNKNTGDIFIQDLVLTYSTGDTFKVDVGLILVPTCYNCNTSAAKLLPVDYSVFGFLSSAATNARVGRDYGAQVRGYVFNRSLEYRAGVFEGHRGEESTEPLRLAGRLSYHFFEKQTGLFYTGTSLGQKKILTVGASLDAQSEYRTYAFDLFYDQPVRGGDGVTFQVDWIRYNGGSFFPQGLPPQNALILEAGYYFQGPRIGLFGKWSGRDFTSATSLDEGKMQAGVAWYWMGRNLSLKLGLGRLSRDAAPDRNELILQLQTFMF
jgi:hypothetical protein